MKYTLLGVLVPYFNFFSLKLGLLPYIRRKGFLRVKHEVENLVDLCPLKKKFDYFNANRTFLSAGAKHINRPRK
jgi:hypothetical protein